MDSTLLLKLHDHLWVASCDFYMGAMNLGGRMTLLRDADTQDLFIYNPIAMQGELKEKVDELGTVRWLMAPSLYHHLHVKSWSDLYPEATVFLPEGLSQKSKNLRNPAFQELSPFRAQEGSLPLKGDCEFIFLAGCSSLNEWMIYHKPSKSLIVCDLFMNLGEPKNMVERLMMGMFGTRNRVAISRLLKVFIQDKQAFRDTLKTLQGLDLFRVIVAHGQIIQDSSLDSLRTVIASY